MPDKTRAVRKRRYVNKDRPNPPRDRSVGPRLKRRWQKTKRHVLKDALKHGETDFVPTSTSSDHRRRSTKYCMGDLSYTAQRCRGPNFSDQSRSKRRPYWIKRSVAPPYPKRIPRSMRSECNYWSCYQTCAIPVVNLWPYLLEQNLLKGGYFRQPYRFRDRNSLYDHLPPVPVDFTSGHDVQAWQKQYELYREGVRALLQQAFEPQIARLVERYGSGSVE